MAEFAAVVQQLALNNAEERERDSNMNRNIAYQAEQTRDATVQGFKFLADMFDDMKNDFVSAAEDTTSAINTPKPDKPDGGADEENQNRMQRLFKNMVGKLTEIKDGILAKPKEYAKKGLDFIKNFAFGGLILAALAFLQSKYWEETKVLIKEYVIPAIRGIFNAFTGIGDSLSTFLEDPSWENFKALFADSGIIIGTIIGMTALFNPFGLRGLLFRGISKAVGGFLGLFRKGGAVREGIESQTKRMKGKNVFGGLRRGLTKMMGAFSSLGTSLMDMATGTTRDAKGQLRSTGKKGLVGATGRAGQFASGATRGVGAVAKGAAKMIPGVGLIATAAFGIFDAVSAGLNEAKKETATVGSIAKESVAGLLSGLTFGLVTQETISNGITKIGEGISGGITAVKDGVMSVVNDPEGTFNSMTSKINELTGLSLPDFATTKESIISTFSNAKDSFSAIGTSLKGKFDGFVDNLDLQGAKSALSGIGDSLTSSFNSFKDSVLGLFSDDRTDEQKLQDRINELTKDTSKQNIFESDAQHKAELDELAALREEYAALIAGGGGGGTTIINNNNMVAGGGGGGGTDTVIVPEPMTNQSHPRNRRRR
tara:strand:- start:119 stop:1912 length:1794 start_codon:yes stop_codon:yes gene_type:complete